MTSFLGKEGFLCNSKKDKIEKKREDCSSRFFYWCILVDDFRMCNSGFKITFFSEVKFLSLFICSKNTLAVIRPISNGDWSTDEMDNSINLVKGSSPKPTTHTSSGIFMPLDLSSCMAPSAAKSLEENIASGGGFSSSNFLTDSFPASTLLLVRII